jgi:TonB family protein
MSEGFKTTALEAQQLEEQVTRQANDLSARGKLISYYLYNAMQEPLAKHVLWVIEHHPDSQLASSSPVNQPYSYSEDKQLAEKKALWRQQATIYNNSPRVLANAATFLQQIDPPSAERLWKSAYALDPAQPLWRSQLAAFYAQMVRADSYFQVGENLLRLWPESNPSYPAQVVAELERSSDAALIGHVGTDIAASLRGSFYGLRTAQYVFQARRSMADRAESFLLRAQSQDPGNAMWTNGLTVLEAARKQDVDMVMSPPSRPTTATELPPATSGDRVKVERWLQERKLIQGEQPAYPVLARQARIQGVVRLDVAIGVDGTPSHIQVRAGHPLLVPAAVEAVRKWRYEPTLLNGRPVEVETVIDVDFALGQ